MLRPPLPCRFPRRFRFRRIQRQADTAGAGPDAGLLKAAIKIVRESMDNTIITEASEYVRALFQGNSDGHDYGHTMRVYRTAMEIADFEPLCDRRITALAALLHDADDHKLFDTVNNANARAFLNSRNVDEATVARICTVINSVSFSRNRGACPELLEGRIVQDADRLDAIGAIGIARTFAYGGKHGRTLDSSIDHFHEKLLLLKGMMHTEKAKEIAENRHAFMDAFLKEWDNELNIHEPEPGNC